MRIGKQNRMLKRLIDRFDTKIYGSKGIWQYQVKKPWKLQKLLLTFAMNRKDAKTVFLGCMAQTNADRIRAMTDDELNKLFHEIYNAGAEDAFAYELGQRTNSFEWTMEWLKQPPKGE